MTSVKKSQKPGSVIASNGETSGHVAEADRDLADDAGEDREPNGHDDDGGDAERADAGDDPARTEAVEEDGEQRGADGDDRGDEAEVPDDDEDGDARWEGQSARTAFRE